MLELVLDPFRSEGLLCHFCSFFKSCPFENECSSVLHSAKEYLVKNENSGGFNLGADKVWNYVWLLKPLMGLRFH